MKVLYIHTAGTFGGASRSLFEIVRAFPEGRVEPHFLTPGGTVEPFFGALGPVLAINGLSQMDDTRYSHYRGLRWLILLRELAYLPGTVRGLMRARRQWGEFDLVHANEVTSIIAAKIARRLFDAPLVVHVRSLQRNAPGSKRSDFVRRFLRREADAVVAIDQNVRSSLPADVAVEVIHNAFRASGGDGHVAVPALRSGALRVGFIGNLYRSKGIIELIEAARLTRDRGVDAEFLIVGDKPPDRAGLKARLLSGAGINQYMGNEVRALVALYGLGNRVHILPFTPHIGAVFPYFDVLAFPSHLDAPGRPIFEAAFSKVPSIVAVQDPKPDTLVNGVTGIALPSSNPAALADAIGLLAGDRERLRRMGQAALALAESNFVPQRNAEKLFAVYERLAKAGKAGK